MKNVHIMFKIMFNFDLHFQNEIYKHYKHKLLENKEKRKQCNDKRNLKRFS